MRFYFFIFLLSFINRCLAHLLYLNSSKWYFKELSNLNSSFSQFMPAHIPSTVHLDLLQNGKISDPYYRDNLVGMQDLEEKDWIYATLIDSTKLLEIYNSQAYEGIELVFEGLDTHANIVFNNKILLSTNNMFRKWTIPNFQEYLKEKGTNLLEIEFYSATKHDIAAQKELKIELPYNYSHSRKAAYQYGWDWGPRLVTCGIWKDSYFKFIKAANKTILHEAEVSNIQVKTESLANVNVISGSGDVDLTIKVEIQKYSKQDISTKLEVKLDGDILEESFHTLTSERVQIIKISKNLKNQLLWWPRNFQKQNMHKVKVQLYKIENTNKIEINHVHSSSPNNSLLLSQMKIKTGFRKINLQQQRDAQSNGTSFQFFINGEYIYSKGSNYIPPDMFMPRAQKNEEIYHQTIKNAILANHNTIRLWGGGQYEHDIFYELCDENGILIWHDFMFACALYPGTKGMIENIEIEARENVKRIRHHPSIMLWSGNNEISVGWQEWVIFYAKQTLFLIYDEKHWQENRTDAENEKINGWQNQIFNITLRKVVEEEDSGIPYIHSSPTSLSTFPYQIVSGDIHYWNVWAQSADIEDYNIFVGRFVSEFGMQGYMSYESITKFTTEEDREIKSNVLNLHQRHIKGTQLISHYLQEYLTEPTNLKEFTYLSQVLQSYAIETALSAQIRNKPYCSGTLVWQLNDVWPVISWSSVDFYGNRKALFFLEKKLYSDVRLFVEKQGSSLAYPTQQIPTESKYIIRAVSDLPISVSATISIKLIDSKGVFKQVFMEDKVVNLPANCNIEVETIDLSSVTLNEIGILLNLTINNQNQWEHIHYFVRPNQFKYSQSNVMIEQTNRGRILLQNDQSTKAKRGRIFLQSDGLTRQIYLYCQDNNSVSDIVDISDNFFDLIPKKLYIIQYSTNPKNACKNISYLSLNQIFLSLQNQ